MPKSKLRGGKKAHNKRVKLRNNDITTQRSRIQQEYENMMKTNYEEFLKNNGGEIMSGETKEIENNEGEGLTIKSDGKINDVIESESPVEIKMDYKPTNPTEGLLK